MKHNYTLVRDLSDEGKAPTHVFTVVFFLVYLPVYNCLLYPDAYWFTDVYVENLTPYLGRNWLLPAAPFTRLHEAQSASYLYECVLLQEKDLYARSAVNNDTGRLVLLAQ